jgi:hypothetical protein
MYVRNHRRWTPVSVTEFIISFKCALLEDTTFNSSCLTVLQYAVTFLSKGTHLASAACILRYDDHSQTQAVRRFNK